MMKLEVPQCIPVFPRNQQHQTNSLPKYLVIPGNLVDCVKQDDLHVKIIDFGEAFFSAEVPRDLRSPLQVQPPEALLNRLLMQPQITYSTRIDVWSIGCLIYELATSSSLVDCYAPGEASVLCELMTLLGPLPQEWIDSLGESYSPSDHDTSLEQKLRSSSEVGDTPGLFALLQRILVLEPLRRPELSEILEDSWFVSPSSPATPSGSASE